MISYPFIIDCDAGCDDAIALWGALSLRLSMRAVVATYGTVPLEMGGDNVARILALGGGEDIPLFLGAAASSCKHIGIEKIVLPRQKKAGNGLCNVALPPTIKKSKPFSAEILAQLSKESGGALDYFICGPATTAAQAVQALGGQASKIIRRIMMIGGNLKPIWGNKIKADFNVVADPFAVDVLMKSGVPLFFVPYDVTAPIAVTLDEIMLLCPMSRVSMIAHQIMAARCRKFAPEPVFRFHDPCVLFAAEEGENFSTEKLLVVLDQRDDAFARIVSDKRGASCEVYAPSLLRQNGIREEILRALGF